MINDLIQLDMTEPKFEVTLFDDDNSLSKGID